MYNTKDLLVTFKSCSSGFGLLIGSSVGLFVNGHDLWTVNRDKFDIIAYKAKPYNDIGIKFIHVILHRTKHQ